MTDKKFKPGQSGNPKGRPKGAADKRNRFRQMLEPHAEKLIETLVAQALDGDNACLKLCIDRLIAPYRPKDSSVRLSDAPERSLTEHGESVITAMTQGAMPPATARDMLSALSAQAKILETDELDSRLRRLESQNPSS